MKKTVVLILFFALMCSFVLPFNTFAKSKKSNALLSPALNVIASRMSVSVSAVQGEDITFTASDFDRFLGVDKVKQIVICSLPNKSAGVLMLGQLRVMEGQVIERSNLKDLRFDGEKNIEEATFTFSDGTNSYTISCNMYLTDEMNYAPTSVGIDESFFAIRTFKNIAVSSYMKGCDPENDDIKFEVLSNPKKGLLTVLSNESGEYVYQPIKNYTGKDSFTYVCYDKYGNSSPEITVSFTVTGSEDGIVFSDMIGKSEHYGAILMHDSGIITGYKEKDGYVFMPDKEISRCDFLVSAMKAANIKADSNLTEPLFNDHNDIDDEYVLYVNTAYKMGVIDGKDADGYTVFCPDESISRAEACVIISRLLKLENAKTEPVFSDVSDVPEYALEAVYALSEMNIIDVVNGRVYPDEIITRADAARMLGAVMNIK